MGLEEEITALEDKREDLIESLDSIYGSVNGMDSKEEVIKTKGKIRALVRFIAAIDIKLDLLRNLVPTDELDEDLEPVKK